MLQGGAPPEAQRTGAAPPAPPAEPGPAEAPPPTDFQRFAATSVGELLPLFGHDLFRRPPSTFAPVDDLPVAADYLVGVGDELFIRGWGQVELDVRAVVSREGTISIPRVGVIGVAGVRAEDLAAHLRAAVGRSYKGFELSVSLGRLRSIQVFVVGQALRPGLYTVGGLSTLVNALFASGGPAPTGSVRRIELRRAGALVGTFDLYDLLLAGDKSKDLRLRSGDVIFVPPVGPLAAIAGLVKSPAVYELAGDGTTLAQLMAHAGGLTTTADTHSVLLERLDRERGRVVQELPWGPVTDALPLRDGDVVQVRAVSQRFDNAVTLRGHVASPVRTAWRPGLTVADLVPDRARLVPERYWVRAAARAFDREAAEERPRLEVERLMEEVNWDYAVVERLDRAALTRHLLPFNLRAAVVERDPEQNLELQPGDIVTVFSQKDVLPPAGRRSFFVRVEGEVATPGIYQVKPGETLRQLVDRVGGLSPDAYLFGAEFTRETLRREQQARLDEIARRASRELEFATAEKLARATSPEDVASTRAQAETQKTALERLKTLRATGRLVLQVPPEGSRVEDVPDLALEDGDRLFVPTRPSTVGVYGAVYNQTSFVWERGHRLDDYLAQAGGPTRSADRGSTYLLRANGSVVSRRQSGWLSGFGRTRLMPSDAVVVPEDYAPVSWVKELKDWSQIFYQFGLGVAAIRILR
jgi:protein involved in polysaccharide export with SLBB domain